METVNNLASAASKAIWGEPEAAKETAAKDVETGKTTSTTQEPVSGVVGDVKAGEPYDKGNDGTLLSLLETRI